MLKHINPADPPDLLHAVHPASEPRHAHSSADAAGQLPLWRHVAAGRLPKPHILLYWLVCFLDIIVVVVGIGWRQVMTALRRHVHKHVVPRQHAPRRLRAGGPGCADRQPILRAGPVAGLGRRGQPSSLIPRCEPDRRLQQRLPCQLACADRADMQPAQCIGAHLRDMVRVLLACSQRTPVGLGQRHLQL